MIELCWSSALRRGGSETRTVGARDAHGVGIPIFIPFFAYLWGTQICQKWEWEWLVFHVCQNSHRSTRCECSRNSLLFLNSNMWHFVVCWRQHHTDSTRFWVEILKLRQLSFSILNVLHFDYSMITDKDFEAKTVECLHFEHLSSFDYSVINVAH